MTPLLEVWLIAARDFRKNVRSVKGIAMFVLALLGAAASSVRLPKFEEMLRSTSDLPPDVIHQIKATNIGRMYGDDAVGERLANAPTKLIFLFFVAVWLAPLLVMIIGFDGISSDLQYRSIRYWTLRCRRGSYYAGKFFSLWAIVALVTLVMQALIWAVSIARGEASPKDIVLYGLAFWATSVPITGAWCAIATMTSSFFKTPIVGLLVTGCLFFILFLVGYVIGRGADVLWAQILYPNNFDAWILSPKPERALEGVGACVALAALSSAIGSTVLARRDI